MEFKVFVGNVPFECTQKEFEECFKDIDGYIRADIVNRFNSDQSRGFGFVTLTSKDNADKLMKRNDITFKDRILRFTEYAMTEKKFINETNSYIQLDDLSEDITRDDLLNYFYQFSEIGKCFIWCDRVTGDTTSSGIVEVLDKLMYETLLETGSVKIKNHNIQLSKYRKTQIKRKIKRSVKTDLFKAFAAGRNIGLLEGFNIAYSNI